MTDAVDVVVDLRDVLAIDFDERCCRAAIEGFDLLQDRRVAHSYPSRQPEVLSDVLKQIEVGANCIHAVMLESHLNSGNQAFPRPIDQLKYGVSITDGCIDWKATEACLRNAAEVIDKVRFS